MTDCWPDLAAVKSLLGVTVPDFDDFLTHKRLVAISQIEMYTGRIFCFGTYTEDFETSAGYYIPKAQPVERVIEVTGNGSYCSYKKGMLLLFRSRMYTGSMFGTIEYEGGFHTIPPGILDVFNDMMAYHYGQQGQAPSSAGQIKKETVMGVVSVEYAVDSGAAAASGSVHPGIASYYGGILDPYILRGV